MTTNAERTKPHFIVTLWLDTKATTKAEAVDSAKELVAYLHRTMPGYGTVDWDVEDWDDDN